jgi:hypothetical protein
LERDSKEWKPGLTFDGTNSFLTFTPTGFPSSSTIALGGFANGVESASPFAFTYGSALAGVLEQFVT